VLLSKLEGDERVGNGFVLQGLWLRVEEAHVRRVHRVEDVLRGWHKLASLRIDLHYQMEELHVEWEVLDVV